MPESFKDGFEKQAFMGLSRLITKPVLYGGKQIMKGIKSLAGSSVKNPTKSLGTGATVAFAGMDAADVGNKVSKHMNNPVTKSFKTPSFSQVRY